MIPSGFQSITFKNFLLDMKNKLFIPMSYRKNCPICENSATTLATMNFIPFEGNPINTFDIKMCTVCGFTFDKLALSQEDLNKYYSETTKYTLPETAGSGALSKYDIARYNYIYEKIKHLIKAGSFILDFGCGQGGLIKYLQSKGYFNIYGFEPSIANLDILEKSNIKAYNSLNYFYENGLKFDIIISSHVLEHVYNFDNIISQIDSCLKNNGALFVEVPNASNYIKHNYGAYYYFDNEHVNHFTPASLKNLLLKYGFASCTDGYARDIESSKESRHSVCGNFFTRSSTPFDPSQMLVDTEGMASIRSYIEKSSKNDTLCVDTAGEKVVLWGLGAFTRRLLQEKVDLESFDCIIDRGHAGKKIANKNIYNSKILLEPEYKNATVVIASNLYQNEILTELKDINHTGEIINICKMKI